MRPPHQIHSRLHRVEGALRTITAARHAKSSRSALDCYRLILRSDDPEEVEEAMRFVGISEDKIEGWLASHHPSPAAQESIAL